MPIGSIYKQVKLFLQLWFYVNLNKYSCSTWFSDKLYKKKLHVAQNKVIRFINQFEPIERITNKMWSELNLVDTWVQKLKSKHVNKKIYNKCPSYLCQIF